MLPWNGPCANVFINGNDMVGAIKIVDSLTEPMIDSALGSYRLFTCRECWGGSRNSGRIPRNTITDRLLEMRLKQFRGIEQIKEEKTDEREEEATPDRNQKEPMAIAGPSKTAGEKRKEQDAKNTPAAKATKIIKGNTSRKELFKEGENKDNKTSKKLSEIDESME